MKNKNAVRIVLITAALLMIPLLSMQFGGGFDWTLSDFIFAAVLLLGAGFTFDAISKRGGTLVYKAATALAVGSILFLIWANLAVGILGNEDNPANVLYFGVFAVWLLGTIMARFRALQMSRVMIATAVAQTLVPIIAYIIYRPSLGSDSIFGIIAITGLFVTLFLASALLFRQANKSNLKPKLQVEQ